MSRFYIMHEGRGEKTLQKVSIVMNNKNGKGLVRDLARPETAFSPGNTDDNDKEQHKVLTNHLPITS